MQDKTKATSGDPPARGSADPVASDRLSLGEEILLLLVEGDTDDLRPVRPWSLACALAGATLMELSMLDRVDTDLQNLFLMDETPTGHGPLDAALTEIGAAGSGSTRFWLESFAGRADELKKGYLDMLSERGLFLAGREETLNPALGPAPLDVDDASGRVRLRVLRCLLTADIPDARDVMIVCLAEACGLFDRVLTGTEVEAARPRIALLRQMDQIGRTITDAIWELEPPVRKRAVHAGEPIPDVPGLPLLGNGIGMAGNPGDWLLRQYRRFGPVFRIRVPGRRYVVLAGVEANRLAQRQGKDLLRSDYSWPGFAWGFGASRLLPGMDGGEHARLRRAHRRGYSRAALNDRIPDLVRIVSLETQRWHGRPVPVVASIRRMVTEQIGAVAAGSSPRGYVDDLGVVVRTLLMTNFMGLPRALLSIPRYRRAHARVRELSDKVWNVHLERPAHMRRDVVDDLLDLHAEDPAFLPETDLMLAMLGPFIAGLDTVTAATSFALHGLLTHPELLREATREADAAFQDGTPTATQVDALDVTRRAVMEAMRLHPVAPATVRRAVNTFEFAGHVIPAGSLLMIAFPLPHRLAEVFPEPERFDIERFAKGREEHKPPGAYTPFGFGTHRCLGAGMAEQQIVATIAAILRHVSLELHPSDYRLRIRQFPTAIPDHRFHMRVTPRS